jgi:hypothetical protein
MWIKIQRRHRDTQYDRYTVPHSSYKSESELHSKPDPHLMSSCCCPCEACLRLSNSCLKTFASLQLVCEWWRSASQCDNLFLQLHHIVNQQQGHSEWQTTDIELVTKKLYLRWSQSCKHMLPLFLLCISLSTFQVPEKSLKTLSTIQGVKNQ